MYAFLGGTRYTDGDIESTGRELLYKGHVIAARADGISTFKTNRDPVTRTFRYPFSFSIRDCLFFRRDHRSMMRTLKAHGEPYQASISECPCKGTGSNPWDPMPIQLVGDNPRNFQLAAA